MHTLHRGTAESRGVAPGGSLFQAFRAFLAAHFVARMVLIALGYVAFLRLGFVFKNPSSGFTAIWPASGFALAMMLIRPRKEWAWLTALFAVVGFINNLLYWKSWPASAALAGVNALECAWISGVLLAFSPKSVDFRRIPDTLRLFAITLALESVPALLAAVSLHTLRGHPFSQLLISWWSSNALGMIVVAPLLVTWLRPGRKWPTGVAFLELALFGLGWVATTLIAFSSGASDLAGVLHPYMLLPMVVWAALRFGAEGATVSVVIVATIATANTVSGATRFPLGGDNPAMRLLVVQMYVAIAQATALLLAGARAQLVAAERIARDGADRLKRALQAARMGTWEWDLRTGAVQWSAEVAQMFGVPCEGHDRGLDWYFNCVHPDDKPLLVTSINSVLAGKDDCRNEHRFVLPTGEIRWVEVRGRLVKDRAGHPMRMVGTAMDATMRRNAGESLRRATRALKALSSCNQVLIRARDEEELLADACRTIVRDCGYRISWIGFVDEEIGGVKVVAQSGFRAGELDPIVTGGEFIGQPWIFGEALRTAATQVCHDIATDPRAARFREAASRHRCKAALVLPFLHDGRAFGALSVFAAERTAFDDAEVALLTELANDLAFGFRALRTRASHRRTRQELAAREALLHQLIRHTPAAVAMFDADMRYLEVSERWLKDYALGDINIIGLRHYDVFPTLPQKWKDAHARVLAGGPVERCDEDDFVHNDGTTWWLQWEIRPWHTSNGAIGGITMFTQVITERREAETALRHQRRRADAIIQAAMDGIVTVDEAGRIQTFNPAAERMFRIATGEAIGESIDRFIPEPVAVKGRMGRGGNLVAKFSRIRTRNEISGAFGEVIGRRTDGVEFPMEAFISHTDLDGNTLLTITLRDLTERMSAERALRDSEERFRQVVENIQEVFWMSDATRSRLLYVSPAYEKIYGRSCESLARAPESWLEAVHPEDRERVTRAASLRLGRGDYHEEYRILRPDGSIRWVTERAVPVRGINGDVYRIVGVAEDVTERRRIEDQFRQAQKMEAIGQLAGGVAHDFNNILGAIIMAASEAEHVEDVPRDARDLLADVVTSAERAANLTRQLLLFSRRQVMELGELDLNGVVGNVARMLRRIVGEDIDIVMRLHPAPLIVQADAGMLEQILVNLAVNARDAMPAGGDLVIETEEVMVSDVQAAESEDAAPGPHVRIRVRDTGTGVSPELLNRIFEPFFTTKEPGRGTGLGLATVFGIIKQHRGWITVDSELGTGTTFDVFVPLAAQKRNSGVGVISERAAARGGSETILLVEDDPDVRKFTRMVLQRVGYSVIDASSGVEAESLWGEHRDRIHLLLTDMVMPDGINGRELARRLRTRDSTLRVIVTSGYSDEFAGRAVGADVGDAFLPKPWKPQQMLDAIRRCLDAGKN